MLDVGQVNQSTEIQVTNEYPPTARTTRTTFTPNITLRLSTQDGGYYNQLKGFYFNNMIVNDYIKYFLLLNSTPEQWISGLELLDGEVDRLLRPCPDPGDGVVSGVSPAPETQSLPSQQPATRRALLLEPYISSLQT